MQKITISCTLFFFIAGINLQAQTQQYALEFDGIDDYVEFDGDLVLPDTLTIEMWVNPYTTYILDPDDGFGQYFLGKHAPDGSDNILLIGYHTHYRNGTYYNDRDGLFVRVGGNGDEKFASGGNRIAGWHHLAVIIQAIDTDSSDVTVYRNGDLLFTAGVSSALNDNSSNKPLVLGMDWDAGNVMTDFFNGQINEVRIWNCVRSQAEIQSNMNLNLTGDEAGLIAYWSINRGQGQSVIDQANAYDGQLGSTPNTDDNDPAWSITTFPYNTDPGVLASSDFEINAEVWGLADGGDGPLHGSGEGNPGGYILGREEGSTVWKFSAPEKFLGNVCGAYGHSICFDMRQILTDDQNDRSDDIILVNDTVSLSFDFRYNPPDTFASYCAPLLEGIVEGRGWINDSTGNTASKEELQTVLSNLTELKIRGEFQVGDDEAWLDNVILYGTPAPVVDFTVDVTEGDVPLEVQFTDNSSGSYSVWNWDFGDESSSNEQNPAHTYDTPGIYTVSLTIEGSGGTDTIIKTDLITVNSATGFAGLTEDSHYNLQIAPNPVSDHCNLNLYLSRSVNNMRISLYDINGREMQLIWSGSMDSGYHSINQNLENYVTGTYYIKMQTEDNVLIRKCILIH